MNRLLILLTMMAVALGGLVLFELFGPAPAQSADAIGNAPGHEIAGPPGSENATMVAAILARPLFRSDRRPSSADVRSVQSGQPTDLPRLTGIMVSADGALAIFQPAGNAKPIVAGEGEMVASWHVQQITADSVTVTGPGGTRKLEPKFSGANGATGISSFAPAQNPVNNSNQSTPPAPGLSGRLRPPPVPARHGDQ